MTFDPCHKYGRRARHHWSLVIGRFMAGVGVKWLGKGEAKS